LLKHGWRRRATRSEVYHSTEGRVSKFNEDYLDIALSIIITNCGT
jgi:hypothetical protein